jgi:prepilin-type processing-associated H-X9-DG protein
MDRNSRRLLLFVAVALLLAIWGSREVFSIAREQVARKHCCERLRECALKLEQLAERDQKPPATLAEWAARDRTIARLFDGELDCYELRTALPGSADADALATWWIVRETKPTHAGALHALFADAHVDVAP